MGWSALHLPQDYQPTHLVKRHTQDLLSLAQCFSGEYQNHSCLLRYLLSSRNQQTCVCVEDRYCYGYFLLGKVIASSNVAAVITMSGSIYQQRFYVRVSSTEESMATDPNYVCCSFAGSFLAIDIPTIKIEWTWNPFPPIGLDHLSFQEMHCGLPVRSSIPMLGTTLMMIIILESEQSTSPQKTVIEYLMS